MRLQNKVFLVALPLAVVFTGLMSYVGRRATERLMVRELGRRLRPQAEDFAIGVARSWDERRESALLARLQQAQAFSGAVFVEALSPDGRVVAHTNVLETGKRREDADTRTALAADRTSYERSLGPRSPVLILSVPVWRADEDFLLSGGPRKRLGTVRFGLPLEETLDSARRIGALVTAMAAGFCLLTLSLTLVFVRALVLRPIQAIGAATARVAAGDYDVEVPVLSRDELGALARSFNGMGTALSRTVVSRDRLEEALAMSRATLDASADGVLVVGKGGKLITFNQRFLEMWSIPEEMTHAGADNIRLAEYVLPQIGNAEEFSRGVTRSDADFETPERRDLLRLKDGRVYERVSRPYLLGGHATGRTLTYRDLTLHLEGLRALAEARDEAVETARIKSQFLANVSHEIRTPLNTVVGSAEMLLGTGLDAEQREYVDNLNRAARALLELVNGVLDFSKIEAGRMTVERTRMLPGALLADAAALLAPRAVEKGLALKTDAGEAASLGVLGDPTRLRQVLLNLLTNAVKFTDRGEVSARIEVLSSEEKSVELEFSVSDTGPGIPAEQTKNLFMPFNQGDGSTTRRFGGTGLGLAISRNLVELMGGTIGFDNIPGGGARFWFRLRLDRVPDMPSAAALPGPCAPEKRRDRLRILVVDDNEINRRLLQRQLERLGCPCSAVDSGRAALDELRAAEFGLILLDCQMPGLDGYATAVEIRRLETGRRRTPIAAITANATKEVRKLCEDAGMDDFVPKPATLSDLAAMIERWDRPFDEAALDAFAAVAAEGPEALARLLSNFVTDVQTRLDAVRAALKSRDFEACRRESHSIKGAAAAIGARGLAELCRRLEAAAEAAVDSREAEVAALLAQADVESSRLRARNIR